LVHKGASSVGGHYVAHILDEDTKTWMLFDDETVSSLEITEDMYTLDPKADAQKKKDNGEEKKNKKKKIAQISQRGYLKSPNCYFLTYSKRSERGGRVKIKPEPSAVIKATIEADSVVYKEEVEKKKKDLVVKTQHYGKSKEFVENVFSLLDDTPGPGFETACNWIGVDWLRKWITGEIETKPEDERRIDLTEFVCQHDRLDWHKRDDMKRILLEAWNMLEERYKVKGKPLTQEDYCKECVAAELETTTSEERIKQNISGLVELIRDSQKTIDVDADERKYLVCPEWLAEISKKNYVLDAEGNDPGNTKIQCKHGNLMEPKQKGGRKQKFRYVDAVVWVQIKSLFPDAVEFIDNRDLCDECKKHKGERKKFEGILRNLSACASSEGNGKYYFIPKSWFLKCKKYLENGYTPPGKIPMNSLRCIHGLLNFSLENWAVAMMIDPTSERAKQTENEPFVLASHEDWIKLNNFYGSEGDPLVISWQDDSKSEQKSKHEKVGYWKPEVEPCLDCIQEANDLKFSREKVFTKANITVELTEPGRTTRTTRTTRNLRQAKTDLFTIGDLTHETTVQHLKFRILEKKDLMPSEQQLWNGETLLSDNHKTLGFYGVLPSKPLRLLKVEAQEDLEEISILSNAQEERNLGFDKTALNSRHSSRAEKFWICQHCTLENHHLDTICVACEAAKPSPEAKKEIVVADTPNNKIDLEADNNNKAKADKMDIETKVQEDPKKADTS